MKQTLSFFGIILFVALSGCRKEPGFLQTAGVLKSGSYLDSALNSEIPDVIVHANGSIQAAVNAAKPGAIIHIDAGIYLEAVVITKPGISLVGLKNDRGEGVVLQNPGSAETGITVLKGGNGFSLRNIALKNFTKNGIKLDSVNGFFLSNVGAINNGEYGIYPVFCSHGVIENCTTNGHADTGIYVGQSSEVVIRFNKAFDNVNGIEAENSTGIQITSNETYNNTLGIFADLLPDLKLTTASGILIQNNTVKNNNHSNFSSPDDLAAVVPSGLGILVLGADNVTVEGNIISGNKFSGIVVFSSLVLGILAGLPPQAFAGIEPDPDGTVIRRNILTNNGQSPPSLPIPLPGVDLIWDGSGHNNCWSDNTFTSSYPAILPGCH